jgi:hypothetical protein
MRVTSASIFFSAALIIGAASGHAFNLSRMLGGGEQQNLATFKLIDVTDLKALMADHGSQLRLYDANIDATRARFGIIPGAILLDSADRYPLSVLPLDRRAKLVFYCANAY